MDVDLDDVCVIRIKLNNDELQDLVSGERIVIDLDSALQIEIYHSPKLQYNTERKNYINGEHDNEPDSLQN